MSGFSSKAVVKEHRFRLSLNVCLLLRSQAVSATLCLNWLRMCSTQPALWRTPAALLLGLRVACEQGFALLFDPFTVLDDLPYPGRA